MAIYGLIIEKTESVYVVKLRCLINGTVASGVLARLSIANAAALCAWFASCSTDLCLYYPHATFQVAGAYIYLRHYLRYISSFHIFCGPIPVLSNGTGLVLLSGGEQECTKKNRTPLARGTIESSVYNGFSGPSGKRLQLETWRVDSKGIEQLANQAHRAAAFVILGLANTPEATVPLIKHRNTLPFELPVCSIFPVYLSLAVRLWLVAKRSWHWFSNIYSMLNEQENCYLILHKYVSMEF